jgi:nucleotide-binding universal stress UspA family protein
MPINHVLIPLDQSELAERALEYAVALVQPQGCLTLLTVIEKSLPVMKTPRPEAEGLQDGIAMMASTIMTMQTAEGDLGWQNANHYLERTAARLESLGLKVNTQVAEGHPAERILQAARKLNVDAIAMSTHGRTGLSRLVMGSVAQKVIAEADCPVFIIPQRARQ